MMCEKAFKLFTNGSILRVKTAFCVLFARKDLTKPIEVNFVFNLGSVVVDAELGVFIQLGGLRTNPSDQDLLILTLRPARLGRINQSSS